MNGSDLFKKSAALLIDHHQCRRGGLTVKALTDKDNLFRGYFDIDFQFFVAAFLALVVVYMMSYFFLSRQNEQLYVQAVRTGCDFLQSDGSLHEWASAHTGHLHRA